MCIYLFRVVRTLDMKSSLLAKSEGDNTVLLTIGTVLYRRPSIYSSA